MHVKKNDMVVVLSGNEAGKKGKVLVAFPSDRKIIIEGINYIWKHVRRTQKTPAGGRIQKEAPLRVDNVALFCPRCNRGVRSAHTVNDKNEKVRICSRCREGL